MFDKEVSYIFAWGYKLPIQSSAAINVSHFLSTSYELFLSYKKILWWRDQLTF